MSVTIRRRILDTCTSVMLWTKGVASRYTSHAELKNRDRSLGGLGFACRVLTTTILRSPQIPMICISSFVFAASHPSLCIAKKAVEKIMKAGFSTCICVSLQYFCILFYLLFDVIIDGA